MRTILSGFMLLGLLGCGDLSSTGKQRKKGIIHQKTREILNANEATKDSNFVIVKLDVQGGDPLTQSVSAYEKLAADAGTIPIKKWIKQIKIVEEHTPTYAELQDWMKKNPGVKLPVLPYKRMYGYDETTGEMVILEKRDEQ